jgi:hypothetical protein
MGVAGRESPAAEPVPGQAVSPLPRVPAVAETSAGNAEVATLPGVEPIVIAARPKLLHRHRESAPAPQDCPPGTSAGQQPRLRYRHREPSPAECPPTVPGSTMPGGVMPGTVDPLAPQPSAPQSPMAPNDAAAPGAAASLPPEINAAPGAAALSPSISEQLAQAREQQDRRISEGLSNVAYLLGDGCAPGGYSGQISVGRICITVPNLTPFTGPTFENTSSAALLEGVKPSAATFNSAQGVAPSFGTGFVLPATNLGSVPGTPTTQLAGTTPVTGPYAPSGATVTPVNTPPASFTAAADNAFRSNPALNTSAYPTALMQTRFDPSASGVVTASGTSGPAQAFLYYDYLLNSAIVLPGYAVGFVKLTENFSPLPRDRVYMNYSYFHNANFFPTRADVNRFMPGFEKTFYDGWTSIELRTPFAATLANSQQFSPSFRNNVSEYRDVQFGNMSTIFKTMLVESETWAITGGVQVMLPTAPNVELSGQTMFASDAQSFQAVYAANEAVHVMPFVGAVWAPNSRFFNQALMQFDRDVNGTPLYVNNNQKPGISGRQLDYAGRVFYPTFMYLSFGTGYWLYKDDTRDFSGFSPVLELHVNQALEEFCPVTTDSGWQLGPNLGTVSVTNALVGCNFEWNTRATLSVGYVTPLGGGLDRFFDGELRAMYNWRFGPQNALRRAQF